MATLKERINQVRTVLEGIGLEESQLIFRFDAIPRSKADNIYRMEVKKTTNEYEMSGGKIQKQGLFSIWICKKIMTKETKEQKRMNRYLDLVCDYEEAVEAGIYTALKGIPITILGSESEDNFENHLVIRIDCQVDYEVIYDI
jgi:hypothetical protein